MDKRLKLVTCVWVVKTGDFWQPSGKKLTCSKMNQIYVIPNEKNVCEN